MAIRSVSKVGVEMKIRIFRVLIVMCFAGAVFFLGVGILNTNIKGFFAAGVWLFCTLSVVLGIQYIIFGDYRLGYVFKQNDTAGKQLQKQ